MTESAKKPLKPQRLKTQSARLAHSAAKRLPSLPRLTTALLLPLLAVGLTGCQTEPPPVVERVVQLPPPKVPEELLMPCQGPSKPVGDWTQKTLVLIADELREALDLCNADKAAIKRVLNQ